MSDLTKKDFIYFQNEVLQDIKKVESKLNEKIGSIYTYIQEISTSNEKRYDSMNSLVKNISDNNNEKIEEKILSQIERLKKKVEDIAVNNTSRINIMQKDLSNACFKYDKIVLDNLKVNGLIGDGCPYKNLKLFIEYINRKIKEIILAKDKIIVESNSLKEKMNNMTTQIKVELDTEKMKMNEIISQKVNENEEKCLERKKNIEEIIKDMRMENYKYSDDLIKRTEELKIQWDKLENIKDEIYAKFDEEKKIFKKYSENLLHTFNSQREEFDIIKSRFIEVRDLIKNVRFKKNLNELVNSNGNVNDEKRNNQEIQNLTKRLNFYKKQRISKKDLERLNKEENNLVVMDKEWDKQIINNENISNNNNLSNNKNRVNNDIKKYMNKANIINIKIEKQINNSRDAYRSTSNNNNNIYNKNKNYINKNKGNYKKIIDKNNSKDKSRKSNTNDNNINKTNSKDNNNAINSDTNNNNDNIYENTYNENETNENNEDEEIDDEDYGNDYNKDYNGNNIDEMHTQKNNNKENYNYNDSNNEITKIDNNNYNPKINEINKKSYTKIKIKSLNNRIDKKIDNNTKNNIENNVNIKYIEKNNYNSNTTNSNFYTNNKIEKIVNKVPEINFSKTAYNAIKNNIKYNIFKGNEKQLLKNMSSNEMIYQKNENRNQNHNQNQEENDEISENNFTNNNILRKKILENKNNQTKYSSLSEDEKTYNNNYYSPINHNDIKFRHILSPDLKKDFQNNNFNFMPLNFGDNSSLKIGNDNSNSNINTKLLFRKFIQQLNLVNYNVNEKFKNFSLDIYKNFDSIKNEINKLYNEISKINTNKNKKILKGKLLNFQINNFDLYNNSGIDLNMNNIKKKINEENYYSQFNRNKLLNKEQSEDNPESHRSILNNVEPFLIKKFRKNQKNF